MPEGRAHHYPRSMLGEAGGWQSAKTAWQILQNLAPSHRVAQPPSPWRWALKTYVHTKMAHQRLQQINEVFH